MALLKQRPISVLPSCFSPEVDDLAVLLLAVGDISHDDPFAQSDGRRQSSETTVTTEHNCACRISECAFVGGLALYDHRQLRHPLAVSVVGPCGSKTYASPLVRTNRAAGRRQTPPSRRRSAGRALAAYTGTGGKRRSGQRLRRTPCDTPDPY